MGRGGGGEVVVSGGEAKEREERGGEGTTPEGGLLHIIERYSTSHKASEHDLSIITMLHIKRFTAH